MGKLTWAGLAGGLQGSCLMGLPSSEGLTGLDVQDDTLTLLALDTGCHLGVPSGTVNQTSYRCLLASRWLNFLHGG